jgi:hypothetical protein
MIDNKTHDEYMKLYKELVDRLVDKEEVIEKMANYIAKYARKTSKICSICRAEKCNTRACDKYVRKYFEERSK